MTPASRASGRRGGARPVGAAYAGVRDRVTDLAPIVEASERAIVPTCPRWTVHDVIAHLVGVVDDVTAGRLEGVATDPWTQAQVDARRSAPVTEMLAEWSELAPAFEDMLDDVGLPGRQAVLDAVTHEHDIRTALGRPGARESGAVLIGFDFVGPPFVARAESRGMTVLVDGGGEHRHGVSDASLQLRGTPFELMRALTGRRSIRQLRALCSTGDCEPVLAAFTYGPFRPAEVDIEE